MSKKSKFSTIILMCFSIFFLCLAFWVYNNFGNLNFEEVIFQMKVPISGSNPDYIIDFIFSVLVTSFLFSFLSYFIFVKEWKKVIELTIGFKDKTLSFVIFPLSYYLKSKKVIFILIIILTSIYFICTLDVISFVKNQIVTSNFIEENYVDPADVTLTFPDQKRNLIYIYLESMESSYTSTLNGGTQTVDLIPDLSLLAEENLSFSNSDLLGGAYSLPGTGWTMAAMVAQTSGLPLKMSIDVNKFGKYKTFLKGVNNLGDILEFAGYNQMLMVGSDATFAGRKNYFQQHGNYQIWDYYTAIEDKKMTEDDFVWWGFDDQDLFTYAKEEITKLSKKKKPFNFTMLTVDTHFEDGYLSDSCDAEYTDQYSSVINCSSKQVYEFVNWIKKQPFYENTTIIISGDHLTMDTDFYDNLDKKYERTIYNSFINSAITTNNTKNRSFSTLDMFPSTLAALGVDIEGDRLGLGTNLFSSKKTLIEKNNLKYVRKELEKTSKYYNKKFIYAN